MFSHWPCYRSSGNGTGLRLAVLALGFTSGQYSNPQETTTALEAVTWPIWKHPINKIILQGVCYIWKEFVPFRVETVSEGVWCTRMQKQSHKLCFPYEMAEKQQITSSPLNPCPAEPRYALHLQTMQIQISWLPQKPTDLDLHCLSLSMWICINNLDQVIWLAEN